MTGFFKYLKQLQRKYRQISTKLITASFNSVMFSLFIYLSFAVGLGMRMTMTLNPNGVGLEAALNKMVGNSSANQLAPSITDSAPSSSSSKYQL
jgi:hypothetical protein